MFIIEAIEAFSDNYIWLLYDPETREAAVVDPGDSAPVERALADKDLRLSTILVTHHHMDHIGGIRALTNNRNIPVLGPASDRIQAITRTLADGDHFTLFGADFATIAVPGHTLDHIAFFSGSPADHPVLFCGDTLFAGGCGRLFEGTPAMMHKSLSRLAELPGDTRVYCAHEYTLANLAFAKAVEPHNGRLLHRIDDAETLRRRGRPTVPSTLELERETNPFLRSHVDAVRAAAQSHNAQPFRDNIQVFATVRSWKDNF